MTSQALEANRRNARLSTGPRTAAGKKAIRHNALTHASLSREVVLDHPEIPESREEYNALLQYFAETRRPKGALEEMLVERIATTYWRLQRIIRAETAAAQSQLQYGGLS